MSVVLLYRIQFKLSDSSIKLSSDVSCELLKTSSQQSNHFVGVCYVYPNKELISEPTVYYLTQK